MKHLGSLLSVVLLVSAAVPALSDTTLYSNGPINGTIQAWNISQGIEVSNSFTLSTEADVSTMSLGIWTFSGEGTPATLQFGISTTPFGTNLGTGTATLSNELLFTNSLGFNVYRSSFTFPGVNLAAGNYWITLFNGMTSSGLTLFWDENDGPSLAFSTATPEPIPSESFDIDGTPIPEPGTLIMLGTGIFGIAGTIRRKLL